MKWFCVHFENLDIANHLLKWNPCLPPPFFFFLIFLLKLKPKKRKRHGVLLLGRLVSGNHICRNVFSLVPPSASGPRRRIHRHNRKSNNYHSQKWSSIHVTLVVSSPLTLNRMCSSHALSTFDFMELREIDIKELSASPPLLKLLFSALRPPLHRHLRPEQWRQLWVQQPHRQPTQP